RDRASSERVVVVNETLARTLWPGQNPLGQMITTDGGRRVVGVVADVRHEALEKAGGPEMYLPMRQTADYAAMQLVVRTALAPDGWIGRFRSRVGNGRVPSFVERAGQHVVWDNDRRPGDIYRGGNASYRGCGDRWVYSRLESIQDRSDGCIAVELREANERIRQDADTSPPAQRQTFLRRGKKLIGSR